MQELVEKYAWQYGNMAWHGLVMRLRLKRAMAWLTEGHRAWSFEKSSFTSYFQNKKYS
jgi:hypothetical protein